MAVLLSVLSMMFTLLSPLERDESYFCTAVEPISVHSRESGNPGAENSAKDWVPASAGTNGPEGDSNSSHIALADRRLGERQRRAFRHRHAEHIERHRHHGVVA